MLHKVRSLAPFQFVRDYRMAHPTLKMVKWVSCLFVCFTE